MFAVSERSPVRPCSSPFCARSRVPLFPFLSRDHPHCFTSWNSSSNNSSLVSGTASKAGDAEHGSEGGALDLGFRADGWPRNTSARDAQQHPPRNVDCSPWQNRHRQEFAPAPSHAAGHRGRIAGSSYFDIHGELTPFILRTINARERAEHRHLSDKLIVVSPGDPEMSVGLNPLEDADDFVRVAEFSQILRERWALDHFRRSHGGTSAEFAVCSRRERSHAARTVAPAHPFGIPRGVHEEGLECAKSGTTSNSVSIH